MRHTLRLVTPCFSQRLGIERASLSLSEHEEQGALCASLPTILPKEQGVLCAEFLNSSQRTGSTLRRVPSLLHTQGGMVGIVHSPTHPGRHGGVYTAGTTHPGRHGGVYIGVTHPGRQSGVYTECYIPREAEWCIYPTIPREAGWCIYLLYPGTMVGSVHPRENKLERLDRRRVFKPVYP